MAARFLHLADLHLGSRHDELGDGAERRAREVKETFRDAVEFALDPKQRIDGILVSGNLFDRHAPDPETLSFVRGLLGRVVAQRKPVVMIPGYRDGFGYKDSVYRTERWPGIDVITDATPDGAPIRHVIGDHEVWFYGVAAQPGLSPPAFAGFQRHTGGAGSDDGDTQSCAEDAAPEEIALEDDALPVEDAADREEVHEHDDTPALLVSHMASPGLHVGLLCAALPDHPEWGLRPHLQTVEPAVLAESELDYVALGGYHGDARYDLDGTVAAYPGTLEGRRFERGDLGEKSLLVVEIDDGGKVELERHPIGRCRLEEWTIDLGAERITDPDGLCAAILARASDHVMARIHVTGPMEFLCDLEQVAEKVRARFRHLELVDATDLLGSGLLRRLQSEHTIRGFFVRRMVQRIADLEERARTASEDASVHHDLEVARAALKAGLEQFLDEEPAQDVLYEPPPRRPASPSRAPAASVDAAPVAAAAAARNGGGRQGPPQREKALLRADREGQDQAMSEEG